MKELLVERVGGLVDKLLDLDDMYDRESWRYDFAKHIWDMEHIIAGDHSLPLKSTMLRPHVECIEYHMQATSRQIWHGLQDTTGWRGRWNEEFRSRFDAIRATYELLKTFAHTGD